ncbi:MAG TPA: PKD domain-containing protein, partial [Bacteroidales bacterium]|nr:PKD domain-containing protein [Bacteroidales bacterium]
MTQLYKRTIFIFAILLFSSMLPTRLLGQAADFTASTTSTCVGGTVIFTDLSTGVTPTTSYVWSFGTGANPSAASGEGPHAVTYNTPGAKTVSLTLTDGSITNTKTRTNYITVGQPNTITLTSGASTNIQTVCLNAALAPTITYATTGATGANFTDLPPGVTGNWNANVVTISGNPSAVGNYNFTITLTGGCGTTTANGSITVNPIPTPILVSSDADNTFCAGTSVTFTAGGGTDFTFRVNGVSKQTGAGPVYTTNTLLNGQVVDVIVISSTGCTATSAGITNTVNDLPNPSIAGPQAICGLPTTAFYSVVDHAGHTYNWTATGGVVSSGQGTSVITA